MNERVPTIIALGAFFVWVASIVLDAVAASYDPPATVHALMMAAAGWAFGERVFRRGGRRNGGDQGSGPN